MKNTIILFSILLLFTTCKQDIVKKNSPRSVFEVFWQTMDERYVYFEEKNLNWDSIYNTYYPKINDHTSDEELKNYFQEIINYIKDGHVLITIDEGDNIVYKYHNYSDKNPYYNMNRWQYLHSKVYIGQRLYSFMAQVRNTILYIKISNFSNKPHLEDLFANINQYNYQDGIIVDISSNGGAYIYLREWASIFFNGSETFLYKKNKTGKAHADFSDYIPIDYEGRGYFKDSIPIALITSGYTYSAGTLFTAFMKELPNCEVFGEATSGGGGGRATIMLPNNWLFHFSFGQWYDKNKHAVEDGIQPDTIVVNEEDVIWEDGTIEKTDLVMEACINYLQTKNKNNLPMEK